MTDSERNILSILAKVLMRCWILGFILLFVSFSALLIVGGMVHELHGWAFGLSSHEVDVISYCWLGMMKIAVLTLFFIPWISIKMVLRNVEA